LEAPDNVFYSLLVEPDQDLLVFPHIPGLVVEIILPTLDNAVHDTHFFAAGFEAGPQISKAQRRKRIDVHTVPESASRRIEEQNTLDIFPFHDLKDPCPLRKASGASAGDDGGDYYRLIICLFAEEQKSGHLRRDKPAEACLSFRPAELRKHAQALPKPYCRLFIIYKKARADVKAIKPR
jgi:hypothetical protein